MKSFVTAPTVGSASSVVVPLNNTLIKTADEELINIAVNGQLVNRRTSQAAGTFAKYYYELVNTNQPYISTPNVTGIETSCSAVLTIIANPDFLTPGYTTGVHQSATFLSSDTINIQFHYVVVRDV